MISDADREIRDVLRARLLLVSRTLRCRRSVGALLEKYNVATPTELPALPRLQAELHAAQRALLVTHIRRLEQELREQVLSTPDAQAPGLGPGHREDGRLHAAAGNRRDPSLSDRASVPFLLSLGARGGQLRRRPGTSAPATAIATSRSPFTMPPCAPSSTSPKSARRFSGCNAARGNSSRGPSSRRNSPPLSTPCLPRRKPSMANSVDSS